DNDYVDRNHTYINVTVSDTLSPNNTTAFIDWNNSLVGWWRFNEESGENETFFRDWSSYGNDGTCNGSNCSKYTTGKFGKGMVFDGLDDYVGIGDVGTGVKTVSFWIKAETITEKIMELAPASWVCGDNLAIDHIAGDVAPVTKSVTYGTAATNLTGTNQCWITRNLGADQQATSASDNTNDSAGWYWQFNRKQGYAVGPIPAWNTDSSEDSNWTVVNDPCTIELGAGWHIPTYDEWFNADANGAWDNRQDAYSSVLKIHTAGLLNYDNGELLYRGDDGYFWSTRQFSTNTAYWLHLYWGECEMLTASKAHGFGIRCLRDDLTGVKTSIEVSSGTIMANEFINPDIYVDGVVSSTIDTDWHHVVITTDIGINVSDLKIGESNTFFNGTIDEVRIHSRTLSAEEINASYNAGLYRLETNYTNLADGTYTYTAYAQDLAGNVNQTETRTVTIDTILPEITIYNPTNATTDDNTPQVNATQTDVNPNEMWYAIDGGATVYDGWTDEIDANTTILSEAVHYITVYANDTAGNQNSTTRYFEVDAFPPVITIQRPLTKVHGGDVWLNISLDQRVSWCGYSFDGAANITMANDTITHYSKNLFGFSEGGHTVTYWCNNTFGVYSSATRNFNFTAGFVVVKLVGSGFSPLEDAAANYVATNLAGGTLAGIVHAGGVFESVSSSTNYMELRQKTLIAGQTAKAFVVYSKGTVGSIENRIPYIQSGAIEKMPNPSFGFGIDKRYRISVGLEYDDIDITGTPRIGPGFHKIKILNNGKNNGIPIVDIRVV
ncbi:MAG: hypothetical protein KAI53_02880, partial [Candidatus Aenigmarchaeota archaeon]|nr:hypothetical protein [Candidatus Aenigmarchaeota archaeon]